MTLRAGIIGNGGYGKVHAASARQMPDITMTGYYDVVPERAAAYAEEFGGTAFENADALIEAVDVVILVTPPTHRVEYIRRIAEAGRSCLCQKPMALHPEETAEICRIVEESGITFGVGFNGRFTPLYMRMADMLADGALGDLVYCWQTLHTDLPLATWERYRREGHWRTKQETSGGRVFEMGSHDIDYLIKLGQTPRRVHATCAISHPTLDTDDTDLAVIEFRNGYAKWELSKAPQSVQINNAGIMGTEAMVATAPSGGLLLRRRGEKQTEKIEVDPTVSLPGVEGPAGITEIRDRMFYDAVLNGTRFEADCWAGKKAADVCRAIIDSAREHQTVSFPEGSFAG